MPAAASRAAGLYPEAHQSRGPAQISVDTKRTENDANVSVIVICTDTIRETKLTLGQLHINDLLFQL